MLTREEENKLVSDWTDAERNKLAQMHTKLMLGNAHKNLVKLIKQKSQEFAKTESEFLEELIDMFFLYITNNSINKKYYPYKYSFEWFRFFIEKLTAEKPYEDNLGCIFHEITNLDKKNLGQSFTPNDLSELISALLNRSVTKIQTHRTFYEPTCGTGSLILATIGNSDCQVAEVTINDLDLTLVKACYIQLALNQLINRKHKTLIIRAFNGDTLTDFSKSHLVSQCFGEQPSDPEDSNFSTAA